MPSHAITFRSEFPSVAVKQLQIYSQVIRSPSNFTSKHLKEFNNLPQLFGVFKDFLWLITFWARAEINYESCLYYQNHLELSLRLQCNVSRVLILTYAENRRYHMRHFCKIPKHLPLLMSSQFAERDWTPINSWIATNKLQIVNKKNKGVLVMLHNEK